MYRLALDYLSAWTERRSRKPLVIRGARQVGKSTLVRVLAQRQFEKVAEINFETSPETGALFTGKSPRQILRHLELKLGTSIVPGKTLLFLDEVQAAPEVLASLRYFHEEMPSLHVLAAGSLLEFLLEEHSFSMPVGRIEYMHMGPMTFEEFLIATNREAMEAFLRGYEEGQDIPAPIHAQFMDAFKEYIVIGGMPEAVSIYAQTGSFLECEMVKQSILSTYADDFNKYKKRVNTDRLRKVFRKVPRQVGGKFKHSHVDPDAQARDIGKAVHLLTLARVIHKVHHSSSNGVPLGAEADDRKFKVLFLDTGLLCRSCGLGLQEFEDIRDLMLVNAGAVCEQFVGQQLLHSRMPFEEPELYYWSREKPRSSAEVDYVLSVGSLVVPVEVKSGKTGTLKSLHVFLKEKERPLAVRFNTDPPSALDTETRLTTGDRVRYRIISLPLYMSGQTRRLLRK